MENEKKAPSVKGIRQLIELAVSMYGTIEEEWEGTNSWKVVDEEEFKRVIMEADPTVQLQEGTDSYGGPCGFDAVWPDNTEEEVKG